jgi:GNAT superfamily N-acetyltransferase
MDFVIERAKIENVNELIALYISVYGDDYPIKIGTNKEEMTKALQSEEDCHWYIIKDHTAKGKIIASCIFELDHFFKIGKVVGVAVDKEYRRKGLAKKLISHGKQNILEFDEKILSLYATSRTLSISSQRMLLENGFFPLGIFPNARKIKTYETLTLLATFKKGVLDRRRSVEKAHEILKPIIETTNDCLGSNIVPGKYACSYRVGKKYGLVDDHDKSEFEFIYAPRFVEKRFKELFKKESEQAFFPFHEPNLLILSPCGEIEIFASFNKKDHYCALMTSNKSILELGDLFKKLIFAMKDLGIYYVEALARLDGFDVINFLTEFGFLPSALYPVMREKEGRMIDYVLMTRTMVPLDFSEICIDHSFIPFIEQYTKQWIDMHLSHFEVY